MYDIPNNQRFAATTILVLLWMNVVCPYEIRLTANSTDNIRLFVEMIAFTKQSKSSFY